MRRTALTLAAAGSLVVGMLATNPAAAQRGSVGKAEAKKSYVVLMADAPAVAYTGGVARLAPTKPPRGKKINPREAKVKAYVAHLTKSHTDALAKAGIAAKPVTNLTYAANGFSAILTKTEAERLQLQKGVLNVNEDVLRQKQTDTSPTFLGLDDPRGGAWQKGITGQGVVVGVIDTGIWPEHLSFADPGGLTRPSQVPADLPCDFGNTAYNPDDKPFTCQNKLLGARDMRNTYKAQQGTAEVYDSARDYDGHGTHTASTAAGNRNVNASIFGINRGKVSGIAPRASIIAYSALGSLGGYGSDLADSIDTAVADGVDVINYSIGSTSPGLNGPDDIAFLFAAQAGVRVATSNGNDGPAASTVGSPASVPWVTAVGASTHNRAFDATATLGNGTKVTGASITEAVGTSPLVDAATLGNELCEGDKAFSASVAGKIVLCKRGVNARVDKSKTVKDAGGVGMILYNPDDAMALVTDNHWVPSVHINYTDGMKVKAYISSTANPTASISEGKKVWTQGSVMADFSSRGPVGPPASADIIRPDVTAPGVNILAGNTPTPESGRPGQLFQSISGTSMSSPHVAGLFALLAQSHPDWSPAITKSAIMTTARQNVTKEDGKTRADPFDMGAGHVDPGKPGQRNSMFNPGLAYDADIYDYVAFACGAAQGTFTQTLCDQLTDAGYSTDAAQLNLPSIGDSTVAGTSVINRKLTNVSNRALRIFPRVQAPAGFDVKVVPHVLTLRAGQTKSYKLKITTRNSAVGAWKFGAITWQGGGYKVRSPIAVKATALNAPKEVKNTGESGTGSYDITFGYSGAFRADSYGLANEDKTTATVDQDPDASFSPGDVGNGATAHKVDLTGKKFYRVVLNQGDLTGPGAASADLDLYLYGPDGKLVASSGVGDTNEIIELSDPTPGIYTLYVHGWGTGDKTVGYTLHSWAISNTPNAGTLKITSAPTSAKVNQAGTIQYSWSGVAEGTTGLGIIEYRNGSSVIGSTAVTITD